MKPLTNPKVKVIWILGLVAFAIHGVFDPIISYLAISVFDVATEANPLMAPHLQGSIGDLLLIHVPLVVLTLGGLAMLTWLFSIGTSSQKQQLFQISIGAWTLIILWGLVVVANNLLVLIQGSS